MKKAQAASEFLMTYGWAFLILLTAIGLYSYFIGFNPASRIPDSCFVGTEFSCSAAADQYGYLLLELKNVLGDDVTLEYIQIQLEDGRKQFLNFSQKDESLILPGESRTIRSYPKVQSNSLTLFTFKNEKEKIPITIYYKLNEEDALMKIAQGEIIVTTQESIPFNQITLAPNNRLYMIDEEGNKDNYLITSGGGGGQIVNPVVTIK
ncbi:MAG: hypothetical protein AB7V77_01780 [Candidatus Woesearchaeota archaeon]